MYLPRHDTSSTEMNELFCFSSSYIHSDGTNSFKQSSKLQFYIINDNKFNWLFPAAVLDLAGYKAQYYFGWNEHGSCFSKQHTWSKASNTIGFRDTALRNIGYKPWKDIKESIEKEFVYVLNIYLLRSIYLI